MVNVDMTITTPNLVLTIRITSKTLLSSFVFQISIKTCLLGCRAVPCCHQVVRCCHQVVPCRQGGHCRQQAIDKVCVDSRHSPSKICHSGETASPFLNLAHDEPFIRRST